MEKEIFNGFFGINVGNSKEQCIQTMENLGWKYEFDKIDQVLVFTKDDSAIDNLEIDSIEFTLLEDEIIEISIYSYFNDEKDITDFDNYVKNLVEKHSFDIDLVKPYDSDETYDDFFGSCSEYIGISVEKPKKLGNFASVNIFDIEAVLE